MFDSICGWTDDGWASDGSVDLAVVHFDRYTFRSILFTRRATIERTWKVHTGGHFP